MASTNFQLFKDLHDNAKPLLIGNAWNVPSALLLQDAGYKAIATSSSAIAGSLGYEDGEAIPFEQLFYIVERLLTVLKVPLSVDLEGGYSADIPGLLENVRRLVDIGVVGINLEDSLTGGVRDLQSTETYVRRLEAVANTLTRENRSIFINARTDAFLLKLPDALAITKERIGAYEKAGATGIFVPFMPELTDIKQITGATALPVNDILVPGKFTVQQMTDAGLRRISLGGGFYRQVYQPLEKLRQD